MSEMDVILGIAASFAVTIGLVVGPVVAINLWNRYVKGEGTNVNSGAKFG